MKAEVLKTGFNTITQATNSPVMFAVKNKVLYLGAHSETVTVVMTADVDEPDFHYVLPAEHARQIAKTLKTGDVTISDVNDGNIMVQSGKAKAVYTIMSTDSISYKLLMMYYKDNFLYKISGSELTRALQTVLPFSVSDVDDPRVKNIHFSIENNVVEVAASNSFTLAKYKFASESKLGTDDLPIKLVGKSLAFLTKTFGESIEIGYDKKLYYKSNDGTFTYKVTVPIVDYPVFPYRALFSSLENDTSGAEIILERDEFIERGKSFLYFTDEDVRNRVKAQYDVGSFSIEGVNSKGSFEFDMTPIKSTVKGEMHISLDYLTKAANATNGAEIALKIVQNRVLVVEGDFSVVIPTLRI